MIKETQAIIDDLINSLLGNDTKNYYNHREFLIENCGEKLFYQLQKQAFEQIAENGYRKKK